MRREKLLKVMIGILLCALSIYIFRPGSYSNDSWAQYIHSTIDWYDDWWGPGLVALFKLLMYLTGKYYSVYLLQMAWYWLFITLLVWDCALGSVRYWVVIAIGMFFNFIPQYVMRDGLMVLCWGCASLLILRSNFNKHRLLKIGVIVLLCLYAMILRPNALVAFIPFSLAFMLAIKKREGLLKPLLYATAFTILIFAANNAATYKVFHANKVYPGYKLKLLDIIGISKLSGHNYLPVSLKDSPAFQYDRLMQNYSPASIDELYWNGDYSVPWPDSARNAATTESWKTAVKNHPLLYLQNRGEGFLYYLRIKKRFTNEEYWNTYIAIDPANPLNVQTNPHTARDWFIKMYNSIGKMTPFFAPWFWLLLNSVLFVFSAYGYRQTGRYYFKILACIQLSGVLYILSQLPIYQHDRDFRYNYWNVFVVIITIGAFRKIPKGEAALEKGDKAK